MADILGKALLDAALAVALDKLGGELTYTQSEYLAIKARRGPYKLAAAVDKSGPGEPVVRVTLRPAPGKVSDPVM